MTTTTSIQRDDRDGIAVLTLAGEFDIATADVLRTAITEAAAGTSRIVLHLDSTEFMDSTTLGILVGASRRVRAEHGWIRLAAPRDQVRTILRITGISESIPVYSSVEAAIAAPSEEPTAG